MFTWQDADPTIVVSAPWSDYLTIKRLTYHTVIYRNMLKAVKPLHRFVNRETINRA